MRATAATVLTLTLAGVAGVGSAFVLHARSGHDAPVPAPAAPGTTPVSAVTPVRPTSVPTVPAPAPIDVATGTTSVRTPSRTAARAPTPTSTTTTPVPTVSTPRPTSTAAGRPKPAPPVTSPEWDVSSLLTAADLERSGFPAPESVSRGPGLGQSVLGYCDSGLPFWPEVRNLFRMDAYFSDAGGHVGQLTARFETASAASDAVERIVSERTACHPGTVSHAADWTSSPVRRATVADDPVLVWTVSSASLRAEETTVLVRSGAFLSQVTVSGGAAAIPGVDLNALAAESGRRLP